MKLILATCNSTKSKWLTDGFSKTDLPIVQIDNENIKDVEEYGATCEQNALIKVREVGSIPNSIVVGEDSGLFIDALNSFPGAKTVRWMEGSDDERGITILKKMKSIPIEKRSARFISAIALLYPNGREVVFKGTLEGSISNDLMGKPGKGYQRIFKLESGMSLAESGSSTIMVNDHRDIAIKKAVKYIKDNI